MQDKQNDGKGKMLNRRDIIKALAGIPVLGSLAWAVLARQDYRTSRRSKILDELEIDATKEIPAPSLVSAENSQKIRLGIIGFGNRGEDLARSLGFAHPDWIAKSSVSAEKNSRDSRLADWLAQQDLNVVVNGICDVFEMHAQRGLETSVSSNQGQTIPQAKRYSDYREMLRSDTIDAVIIATPDHLHAQMTIDAVKAGKHVYCEKCMTRTADELFHVYEEVKKGSSVFQLGHQSPQSAVYIKAREVIKKNILGKITLVDTNSNRNTPHGAWIRHLDKNGNPKPGSEKDIDWKQWLGDRPKVPFSIDRFYNWTKWFDYGTGLAGQLMCHEVDAVNQVLDLGVPESAVASGGIYFYKDNREIPDIFQAVLEYPQKDLTFTYSASLASSRSRGKLLLGHDASMEIGSSLNIIADARSTRYKKKISQGIIDTSLPLFTYQPGAAGIDAVTSATEKYYASRGLIDTYRGGKRIDVTHLHLADWLDCVRTGNTPKCNIEKAFEVTLACHMATISYLEKRRVEWDPVNHRLI